MIKKFFLANIWIILAVMSVFLSGEFIPNQKPKLNLEMQVQAINFDKDFLKIFNLGLKKVLSSMTWITTMLNSDLSHYEEEDLNSWMFHRFDLISDLDPNFIQVYWFGGQYLSVVKDDDLGAEKIFLKGIKQFPNDYFINYYLGSHYLIELKNEERALKYYKKIYNHPNVSEHIRSLTVKMLNKQGFEKESKRLLLDLYNKAPEGTKLKEKYKSMLKEIAPI